MKTNFIKGLIILILGMGLFSCSKKQEMTKMISADQVTLSGSHKQLLKIASDSVKIMLVCTDKKDDTWEVRALIPMTNTKSWSKVPDNNPRAASYYKPSMGNLEVDYLDANESSLNIELKPNWDVVASILASDEQIEEKVLITDEWENLGDKSYKTKKDIFDRVAGIALSKMELTKVYTTSSSSSSSKSIYDDVIDTYNSAVQEAVDAYEEALEDAIDAYESIW